MNEEMIKVAENTVETVSKVESKGAKIFIIGVGVGATGVILIEEGIKAGKKIAAKNKEKKANKAIKVVENEADDQN